MYLKRNKKILVIVILLLGFGFFSDLKFVRAADDCGKADPVKGDFSCFDINKDADKFVSNTCQPGHCSGPKNIQCCKKKVTSSDDKCGEGSLSDKKCINTQGMTPKQREDAQCVSHKCPGSKYILCCKSNNTIKNDGKVAPSTQNTNSGCVEPITGVAVPCPLGNVSIPTLIGRILSWLLALSGTAFLLMFLYGGMEYIVFADENQKAENGKKTIVYAVIGMVIIAFSAITLNWVLGILQ